MPCAIIEAKNAYKVGDTIVFEEYDSMAPGSDTARYTGRKCVHEITHVMRSPYGAAGVPELQGLARTHVALGLKPTN